MDPEVLRTALPGTERLDRVDATTYSASWRVRLGPITGSFGGTIVLSDVQAPASCHMTASGSGAVGLVTGEGDFRLRDEGEGTALDYNIETRISGRLASIGQRLAESSMRSLVRDALQGLSERIRQQMVVNSNAGRSS